MHKGIKIALALVAMFGFVPLALATTIDFESPTYTAGVDALDGVDGWTSTAAGTVVLNSSLPFVMPASAGSQSAAISGDALTTWHSLTGCQDTTQVSLLLGTDVTNRPTNANTYSYSEVMLYANGVAFARFGMQDNASTYVAPGDPGQIVHLSADVYSVVATLDFVAQTYSVTFTNVDTLASVTLPTVAFLSATTVDEANSGKLTFQVGSSATPNGTPWTAYVDNVSIIPEPGAFVLLATGLIGLLAYAWRKRR